MSLDAAPIIELRAISKKFLPKTRADKAFLAIDSIDLTISKGDIFGIIGYSGAGKSTLVRLINGLEKPTSGTVTVAGHELTSLSERKLRTARLGIGMIFQQFNLFGSKNVWRNIEYPLIVAGIPTAERNTRVSDLLNFVGLADKAANYPGELSGGQKQRVGIARALATRPAILLADEATSSLDPETTREVLALLKRVNEEFGTTIVIITHEMEVIRSIANRVAVMEAGVIIERGDVFDVFSNPQSRAAKRFVSTIVRAVPEQAELDQLRQRHPGRIVTFTFGDNSAVQSEIFLDLARRQIGVELVYGGINDIQGRTFGHLTLALRGADVAIDAALAALRQADQHDAITVTEVK